MKSVIRETTASVAWSGVVRRRRPTRQHTSVTSSTTQRFVHLSVLTRRRRRNRVLRQAHEDPGVWQRHLQPDKSPVLNSRVDVWRLKRFKRRTSTSPSELLSSDNVS